MTIFDRVDLEELHPTLEQPEARLVHKMISDIMAAKAVVVPLKVREREEGGYEIVDGMVQYVAVCTLPARHPARRSIPVEIS